MSTPVKDVDLGQIDEAFDAIDGPTEIYAHRDFFRGMEAADRKANGGDLGSMEVFDYDKQPVIERQLGSTKEMGTYNDTPVFSHGKDVDKIYITNDEPKDGDRSHGWFKDGEITTAP